MKEIKQSIGVLWLLGIIFLAVGVPFLSVGVAAGVNGMEIPAEDKPVLMFAFGGVGAVFVVLGLVFMAAQIGKGAKRRRLLQRGTRYEADIVNMYQNTSMAVNHRFPYVVECTYYDGRGQTVLVKSSNLWPKKWTFSPEHLMAAVYVNPDNPKDYYVAVYDNGPGYENHVVDMR